MKASVYVDLALKGLTVQQIAERTGKPYNAVYSTLWRMGYKFTPEQLKPRKWPKKPHRNSKYNPGIACPYSPDCFSCPLPDCRIPTDVAPASVNKLKGDFE